MIQRENRFHGLRSLGFVLRRGQTVREPGLVLKFVFNPRRTTHRVSVAVSRKVSKSAVVRNRIRRRLYEQVRSIEGHITKPYDMLFIVQDAGLAEAEAADVGGRVQALMAKSGVINGRHPSAAAPNRDIVTSKETSQNHVYDTDRPADL